VDADSHRGNDDREHEVSGGVPLHRHARAVQELAFLLGEGFELAKECALPEGELDRAH
jgi:hypothetical protein